MSFWIDYRFRSRLINVSAKAGQASRTTFNPGELEALVTTAHSYGVKVAAHATNCDTIKTLLRLDVDSIQRGYNMDGGEAFGRLVRPSTVWVPTLAAYYTISGERADGPCAAAQWAFKTAVGNGVENVACGGDTGVFSHGDNTLEMKLMVKLGADWRRVLKWGILGGWECVRSKRWEGYHGRKRLAEVDLLMEDARILGDSQ
jgi:imidazolonepropionase-like amidohydrolase